MKTKFFVLSLLSVVIISSCKKDDPEPAAPTLPPAPVYVISKDSTYDGNTSNTLVREFVFANSTKKLSKVNYKYGSGMGYTNYDSLTYNPNGKVSKVESYTVGNPVATATNAYFYTGNDLTSVYETGTNTNGFYSRTRTFTYTSGKISAQSVVYSSGSGTGNPENITSIVYSGNNVSSADLTGIGPVTLTAETTAANPYYGLNFDSEDFLNILNKNNVLKAYLTANPTQIFVDNTYTYASGRVASFVDASQTPARTTYIFYQSF